MLLRPTCPSLRKFSKPIFGVLIPGLGRLLVPLSRLLAILCYPLAVLVHVAQLIHGPCVPGRRLLVPLNRAVTTGRSTPESSRGEGGLGQYRQGLQGNRSQTELESVCAADWYPEHRMKRQPSKQKSHFFHSKATIDTSSRRHSWHLHSSRLSMSASRL